MPASKGGKKTGANGIASESANERRRRLAAEEREASRQLRRDFLRERRTAGTPEERETEMSMREKSSTKLCANAARVQGGSPDRITKWLELIAYKGNCRCLLTT